MVGKKCESWAMLIECFVILKCFRVDAITEKRIKRWALSMEDLVSDATGKLVYFAWYDLICFKFHRE